MATVETIAGRTTSVLITSRPRRIGQKVRDQQRDAQLKDQADRDIEESAAERAPERGVGREHLQ